MKPVVRNWNFEADSLLLVKSRMEANGLGAIMKGDLGATVAVCRDVYTEASRDQRGGGSLVCTEIREKQAFFDEEAEYSLYSSSLIKYLYSHISPSLDYFVQPSHPNSLHFNTPPNQT